MIAPLISRAGRLSQGLPGQERHEAHGTEQLALEVVSGPCDAQQILPSARADRNHEPPALVELCEQRIGHRARRRGDEDALERRLAEPALETVAVTQAHVVDAQLPQAVTARPD